MKMTTITLIFFRTFTIFIIFSTFVIASTPQKTREQLETEFVEKLGTGLYKPTHSIHGLPLYHTGITRRLNALQDASLSDGEKFDKAVRTHRHLPNDTDGIIKLTTLRNANMSDAEKFDLCIKFVDKESDKPEYKLNPMPSMTEIHTLQVVCRFKGCTMQVEAILCPIENIDARKFNFEPDFYMANSVNENCYYRLREWFDFGSIPKEKKQNIAEGVKIFSLSGEMCVEPTEQPIEEDKIILSQHRLN